MPGSALSIAGKKKIHCFCWGSGFRYSPHPKAPPGAMRAPAARWALPGSPRKGALAPLPHQAPPRLLPGLSCAWAARAPPPFLCAPPRSFLARQSDSGLPAALRRGGRGSPWRGTRHRRAAPRQEPRLDDNCPRLLGGGGSPSLFRGPLQSGADRASLQPVQRGSRGGGLGGGFSRCGTMSRASFPATPPQFCCTRSKTPARRPVARRARDKCNGGWRCSWVTREQPSLQAAHDHHRARRGFRATRRRE